MQNHRLLGWWRQTVLHLFTSLLGELKSFMLDVGGPYVMMDFHRLMLLHYVTF